MGKEAIIIEDVWKSYLRGQSRKGDLRATLSSMWSGWQRKKESFFALQEINLTVNQGEILGIVGPNGAGKSTLLKLLSQITYPSRGKIILNGSLSSMLEVGTGFHPELTGFENIYLNGAILGMSRNDVSAQLDSIVDFSGLEPFLQTPVKHYSSGMYVRLAFAVASHLRSDIILVDEILGVGDQEFRKKCLEKLVSSAEDGRTVLIVSHQMSYLRAYSQTGIHLHEGRIMFRGSIEDTISHYLSSFTEVVHEQIGKRTDRKGNGRCMVSSLRLTDQHGHDCIVLHSGQELNIEIGIESKEDVLEHAEIRIDWIDQMGHQWFVLNNTMTNDNVTFRPGKEKIICTIPKLPLNEGMYSFDISVFIGKDLADHVPAASQISVEKGIFYPTGRLPKPSKGILVDYHWSVKQRS